MKYLLALLLTCASLAAQVTHKNAGGFTFDGPVYIADPVSSTSPVTLKTLYDTLETFSAITIYGATNEHPEIAGSASLLASPPASEQRYDVVIDANDTDFDAGVWWYTNKLSIIDSGKYFGRFWTTRDGGSGVTAVMRLVYTNVVSTANGTLDTSASESIADTALRSYRLNSYVDEAVTAAGDDLYLGVGMTFRKTGAGTSTVTIYMGDPYDTHLEPPGLGPIGGSISATVDVLVSDTTTNRLVFVGGILVSNITNYAP